MKTFNFILIVLLSACKIISPEQDINQNHNSNQDFDTEFKISANAQLFFKKLSDERKQNQRKVFKPSKELITKYHLKKVDNSYYIRGFIKTVNYFNPQSLRAINVNVSPDAGKFRTISIPLNKTNEFLKIKGIKYFELSKKAEPKTN
ncbi:MAG: hypothetical protein K9I47_00830 [Bacteroidales bacterium]|nr:hypothetical protein [Bacteroidales bacterium]